MVIVHRFHGDVNCFEDFAMHMLNSSDGMNDLKSQLPNLVGLLFKSDVQALELFLNIIL